MIENATITRIDTRSTDGAGELTYATGASIAVRCCVDVPANSQRWALGSTIAEAEATVYVPMSRLASAPNPGDRVRAQLDGLAARDYEIVFRRDRVHPEQSHYELYVKGV